MEKLTVSQVADLLNQVADARNLENWRDCHSLIGVSDRTIRRWRSKADSEPHNLSMITFTGFAQLKTIALNKSFIEPVECDWSKIPSEYITNHKGFTCPPKSVLTAIIGKGGLLGLTRVEVANRIKVNRKKLTDQINFEQLSFGNWSLILLLCGVPQKRIFYR